MAEGEGRVRMDLGFLAVRSDQMASGNGQQIRLALRHQRKPSCRHVQIWVQVSKERFKRVLESCESLWNWGWGRDGTTV